eukprot:SAG31_NODE_514_length_14714_cov_78.431269_8_plen_164_part_00
MSLDLCTVHVHVGFSRYPVFKALFLRPSVSQTTWAVPVIFKNTAEKYRFILKHRSVHGRMSRGASSSYMLVANIHIYSTGSEVPIYFKTQIRARTHVPRAGAPRSGRCCSGQRRRIWTCDPALDVAQRPQQPGQRWQGVLPSARSSAPPTCAGGAGGLFSNIL